MSIGEAAVLIFSIITVMGSLVIILRALLSPIKEQVYNHLPTQIKDLKDNQKEIKDDIKALNQKVDQNYKALDQKFDQTNQKIDQNYKALDQKFDQTNQKIDQNFKEVVMLLSKDRAS